MSETARAQATTDTREGAKVREMQEPSLEDYVWVSRQSISLKLTLNSTNQITLICIVVLYTINLALISISFNI